jgi:ASPM-SPD-2-Hydin domain-containing protein/HYDIN/CFA65/VesB family protein/flagellar associated PapD-like protein
MVREMARFAWVAGASFAISAAACQCGDGGPGLSRVRAQIAVTPEVLSFGEVPIGAKKTLSLSIQNKGTDVLRVCVAASDLPACESTTRIDPEDAPFRADPSDPDAEHGTWSVERGSMRDFAVTFAPVTQGTVSAKLILVHDAANGPTTEIPIDGTGVTPDVRFSDEVLDFHETTVNQRKTLDLVLTNMTDFSQPVTIDPIAQPAVIFGTATSADSDTPPGSAYTGEIPPMGMLAVHVWYQPPDVGMHQNMLHVTWCPTCAKDVGLKGVGIKPGFELRPASLDFGSLPLGTVGHQSFSVKNIGNVPLEVNTVVVDSGTSAEFSPHPAAMLPKMLAMNEELVVVVDFQGMSGGSHTGRIRVETNAYDDPMTASNESIGFVAVQANSIGPNISAVPRSIDFGNIAVGTRATRNLVLQNAGNSALAISSIQLDTPTAELTIANLPSFPATLQPAASIQLSLAFVPVDAGMEHATVLVASDDPLTPMLTIPVNGTGGNANACALSISPSPINFGLVERGRTQTLGVSMKNVGSMPCNVTNLHLTGGPQFSLPAGPQAALMVASGVEKRIEIAYAPDAYGMHMGALVAASDDPGQANISVPISGTSADSDLLIAPSSIDFGVVPLGCSSPVRTVTLYNTGANAISISQVFLDPSTPADFTLLPFTTPQMLQPGGQAQITLRYHPASALGESGLLIIVHSASQVPSVVPLLAEGAANPTVTDTFQQNAASKVDVLFVVDDSSSMANNQMNLGMNLPSFLASALALNIDFHIGVTTTDVCTAIDPMHWCDQAGEHGRLVGATPIMTPQTASLMSVFQTTVTGVGTEGSTQERGLEAAFLALSDPMINAENAGFLRSDAALAVIAVSDDDDSRMDGIPGGPSEVTIPGARSVAFYESFFWNIKGFQNKEMFSFNAVIEEAQGMCSASGQPAEASGVRYAQVAQDTGGAVASLCTSDWGSQLASVGLSAFGGRRRFTLSSVPLPGRISVTVNGVSSSAWTYDQTSNSVVFNAGATPPANATVVVTYPVACS